MVFDGVQFVYGKLEEEIFMCKWGLFAIYNAVMSQICNFVVWQVLVQDLELRR